MSTTFKHIDISLSQSDLEKIANRKSFRGEEFFATLEQATERAKERSLLTKRVIYLAVGENEYMIHSHGVELKKYKITTRFRQGSIL